MIPTINADMVSLLFGSAVSSYAVFWVIVKSLSFFNFRR